MHRVTYSMGMSLDGYIVDPHGRFDWGDPDEEVFRSALDELRGTSVHLMGRRLYEVMLYWETAATEPGLSALEQEWATAWNALPKVVFSTTLSSVTGSNMRLAEHDVVTEIRRLQAEPGDGEIALGGAGLAAAAADADLIDEYRPRISPVLVGGGTPYFPHHAQRSDLELLETRTFRSAAVHLRYRVVRPAAGSSVA